MTSTPWGASQTSKKYAPGIMEYSTASHGGFHLSKSRQQCMPDCLRHAKDEVLFFEKHKDDWIVISALRCERDNTLVDVTATKGGKRSQHGQRKDYIVTAEDYDKRNRFGFVITDQEEINHAN
jgi:hypothetical protein